MSYTPINWQTGQTITAEKLNRCDNGWSVDSTQLFSETVTTTEIEGEGFAAGAFSYAESITADSITVTFDGTDYLCTGREGEYGAEWSEAIGGIDFSVYPFQIYSGESNEILTETAGTYTIAVKSVSLAIGDSFKNAVQSIGDEIYAKKDAYPYIIELGVSTFADVWNAIQEGRAIYRRDYTPSSGTYNYAAVIQASFDDFSVQVGRIVESQFSVITYTAQSADGLLQ